MIIKYLHIIVYIVFQNTYTQVIYLMHVVLRYRYSRTWAGMTDARIAPRYTRTLNDGVTIRYRFSSAWTGRDDRCKDSATICDPLNGGAALRAHILRLSGGFWYAYAVGLVNIKWCDSSFSHQSTLHLKSSKIYVIQ